jgi:hypothetical protein
MFPHLKLRPLAGGLERRHMRERVASETMSPKEVAQQHSLDESIG